MTLKRETTLIRVNKNCDSLRTTIPKPIMELLELKEGNKIIWDYDPKHKDIIKVSCSNGNDRGGG
jgi:hypothetical protein